MQLDNGKGSLFSIHAAYEVAQKGTGVSFYDMETGEKLSAFKYGKWITVVIELDGMAGANNYSIPRIYLQIGAEVGTEMYFQGMTLINEF